MKEFLQNIIKIETPTVLGSGLYYQSPNNPNQIYIFTAKHCILGNNFNTFHKKEDIKLTFFDANNIEIIYLLREEDFIIHDNNEKNDLLIIVINKENINRVVVVDTISNYVLVIPSEKNNGTKCLLSGFPNSTDNEFLRTLNDCKFQIDSDFQYQIQIQSNDPVVNNFSAGQFVKGYSGGSIFLEQNERIYVLGIITNFEKSNKRFHALSFDLANELLEKSGLNQIELSEIETDKEVLKDLLILQDKTNRLLNSRIKNTVGGKNIERRELLNTLIKSITSNKLTVVYGRAGIGKSAIVKSAFSELNKSFEIFALQAQELDKSSIDKVLKESLGIESDINRLLDSKKLKLNKILLIDSIEKLIESENAETIIDFIDLLQRKDFHLVLTCRTYAVERFKLTYLDHFSFSISSFEVDDLQGFELTQIMSDYPHINSLYQKGSLVKILHNPFFLNMATLFQHEITSNENIDNEVAFKKRIWEFVVEKRNLKRGELLTEIALKKAKSMSVFVKIELIDNELIQELVQEEVIEPDIFNSKRFTPAHDIYEDLALTRYIEDKYQDWYSENLSIIHFFQSIGNERAIRRVFRIWIADNLQQIDYNLEEFINKVLQESNVNTYWKDELLIAILQSPFSEKFLNLSKNLLLLDDANLFKKCLSLLISACQIPNFNHIKQLEKDKRTKVYENEYLLPIGQGWESMISFIDANYEAIAQHSYLIIDFILQWRKKINHYRVLPVESKQVGHILLGWGCLDRMKNEFDDWSDQKLSQYQKELSIITLFQLTEVIKDEINQFIKNALAELDTDNNWKDHKYYEKIIELSLSWWWSDQLCENLPELICNVAQKHWYEYPKEEISDYPFYQEDYWDKSTHFGINDDRTFKYFPASANQTFVYNLMRHHPFIAIDFIIHLTNHTINTYIAKHKKGLMQVRVEFDISFTNTQWGNDELWRVYRGSSTIMPYLYQSVMMALENWLLEIVELCKHKDLKLRDTYNRMLKLVFRKLLLESKSVTTTAVLASVSVAHPDICAEYVLPILKVKEFYKWDMTRFTFEVSVPTPFNDSPQYIIDDRNKANKLPHRKQYLEVLTLKLSLSEHRQTIFNILDKFYASNSDDNLWKLALNRMDLRKQELIYEGNYIALQPKLDEDLVEFVEPAQIKREVEEPFLEASNWIHQKYDNKTEIDVSFEKWQSYYELYQKSLSDDFFINIYKQPGKLASIGIRDYFELLSELEANWCISQVFRIIDHEIDESKKDFGSSGHFEYSPFDVQPCFEILPEIIHKYSGDLQRDAKSKLFILLILAYQEQNHNFKDLSNKVKNYLCEVQPTFSLALFTALIKYASIAEKRYKGNTNSRLYEFDEEKRHKELNTYELNTIKIINELLADNYEIDIENINWDKLHIWTLNKTMSILPNVYVNPYLQDYVLNFLDYILTELKKEDTNKRYLRKEKIPHQVTLNFQKNFADYILSQPSEYSLKAFEKLINWAYQADVKQRIVTDGRFEFVKRCLIFIITSIDSNHNNKNNFLLLWGAFFNKIEQSKIKYYSNSLLLSIDWREEAIKWVPIEGQKSFFDKVINHLQYAEPTIKLLSGIGFTELMPEGINWYAQILRNKKADDPMIFTHTEKMVKRVFYKSELRKIVKNSPELRDNFIFILEFLIDNNSTIAFLIRDEFISRN